MLQIPNSEFKVYVNMDELNKCAKYVSDITYNPCGEDEMIKWMESSYKLEHERINTSTITAVSEYMCSHDVPKVDELYEILFHGECIRNEFVGVFRKQTNRYEVYYNVGMNPQSISLHQLQSLVDYSYSQHSDIISFICYLLYERIHPHIDGNGRMGRLLFIENVHSSTYFPLSEVLLKLRQPHLMSSIFKQVNFEYVHYTNDEVRYPDDELYYQLNITDELLHDITELVYTCKMYMKLCQQMEWKEVVKLLRKKDIRNQYT